MEADPLIPVTETMPAQAIIASALDTTDQSPATPFDDLASVIALYEQRVYRFLLSSLRDRDLAQTLTQETFLRAWSTRASFRSDCSIATWLMRLALNLVRDHTRTERFRFWKRASATALDASEVSAHIPNHESSPEARLIASQQLALVWESVGQLSERQRSVFLLRFVEELELSEIATITGMPISTVKSHLYRALHAIRARQTTPDKKESL